MSHALRTSNFNQTNRIDEFKTLAQRYAEIGANAGIRIIPFASDDMSLVKKATLEERVRAIEFLKMMIEVHEETTSAGYTVINSAQLLWRALRRLSLVPDSNLFDCLKGEEGAVVIYGLEQKVLFWNLQFFQNVSLTVEQVLFSSWYEVTKRSNKIQESLYELATKLVSGEVSGYFETNVPGHEVQEVGSIECLRTWMELPWGMTLNKDGKTGGFLIVQRMKVLM